MIADLLYFKGKEKIKHKYLYSSKEWSLTQFKDFIETYINNILQDYTVIVSYYVMITL